MKVSIITKKYALDSAIKFPKKIDLRPFSLHKDHTQVWELKQNIAFETSVKFSRL